MNNIPYLSPEEDHRANMATAVSICICITLIILGVRSGATWSTYIKMCLAGLGMLGGSNLIARLIIKKSVYNQRWAIMLVRFFLRPLVPLGLAFYMAGGMMLMAKGVRAAFMAIFG